MLGPNVPVHGLSILAAHIAVRALETRQVDAFEPVVATHAARRVKGTGASWTWKPAPVKGRL